MRKHKTDGKYHLEVSQSLGRRIEKLVRRNHEIFRKTITDSESRSGSCQNQTIDQSPSPSPYGLLPEKQENILRREIIQSIIEAGCAALEAEPETVFPSKAPVVENTPNHFEQPFDDLDSLWRSRDPHLWQKEPILFLRAGRQLLSAGEPLLAYDVLSEGVEVLGGLPMLGEQEGPAHALLVSFLQQQSLALAQSGATEEANAILSSLHADGLSDSETLGILGRTWKDMALASRGQEQKKACFQKAFACYNESFAADIRSGCADVAYYTGINAASVSLLAGDRGQSRAIAAQVMSICTDILEQKHTTRQPVSYWLYATLGEAALLQGDADEAEQWYRKAAAECELDIRALASMRKQARLILGAAERDENELDHCFRVPSVVLFSGHLVDHLPRDRPRFPEENVELVRSRIGQWLEENNAGIGYSSAACGADILFLEEMLSRGGEINIVLPFEKDMFIRTSVDVIQAGDWRQRFEMVLGKASEVKILSQYNEKTLNDDLLFANLYLYGTSLVRSERAGTDLKTLLVWDQNSAKSIAGTAALAHLIKEKGGSLDIISPRRTQKYCHLEYEKGLTISGESGSCTEVTVGERKACHHAFLPLLFADVKGYSRMGKKEKLMFASKFMCEIAAVINEVDDKILGRKTQGDSLFLVFRDLPACVQTARAIRELTAKRDWSELGLSQRLTMRISLDAGPCYSYLDPITGQRDFCGDYIVRAARLEPVTPPGNIYASETFVAVAKALGVQDIKFSYAGQVELPKGYGRMQAFHVK